jgi:hypothetical protein
LTAEVEQVASGAVNLWGGEGVVVLIGVVAGLAHGLQVQRKSNGVGLQLLAVLLRRTTVGRGIPRQSRDQVLGHLVLRQVAVFQDLQLP